MEYRTALEEATDEIVEKKSRFIGRLVPVKTWEEAEAVLDDTRSKYKGARHYAYACILRGNNIKRFSDDGEPQGTAGAPMLELLERENLSDVIAVVTRYFGGTLLGVGGLIRAYSGSTKAAIEAARIVTMEPCAEILMQMDYNMYGRAAYALPKYQTKILEENFDSEVRVRALIRERDFDTLKNELTDVSSGTIKTEIIEKRFDFIKKLEK